MQKDSSDSESDMEVQQTVPIHNKVPTRTHTDRQLTVQFDTLSIDTFKWIKKKDDR